MSALFWLFFALLSTVFALVLSVALGALNPWIAVASLVCGGTLGRYFARHWESVGEGFVLKPRDALEGALMVLVAYFSFRHFVGLIIPTLQGISTLNANNSGDLSLHINYIRSFALGIDFPPRNAIYAAEPLRYAYGIDLFNGLFESVGVALSAHLLLTGLVATGVSLALLRAYGGSWAIGGFFFNCGWLGWVGLMQGELLPGQWTLEWKNFFLALFIPQRGLMVALPVGLLLLLAVLREYSGESRQLSGTQKTALGLLWGFLPLFHLHSFVAVSLCMALYAARERGVRGVGQLLTSRMAAVAYLPATLLLLHSTDGFSKASVAHVQWGWTAKEGEFLSFLVGNFGFWLLLPLAIAFAIHHSKEQERRALWIEFCGALALWALFFNLMLAPWAWDNIKVLIWPYLLLLRLACVVLDAPLKRLWGGALRVIALAALLLPGIVVVYESQAKPARTAIQLYQEADLSAAGRALEGIGPNAVFASATGHNHALAYWGRMRVHGFEGHVWSHGIQGQETLSALQALMRGEAHGRANWDELARTLGVTHIFWGPDERAQYGAGPHPWMHRLRNRSAVAGYEVYEIKP